MTWDASLSAFSMWIVIGFLLSSSDLKINGIIKGLLISFLILLPSAICPLEEWISDELMQKIAAENNLSETAFFVKTESEYMLRWFTPKGEIDLCGHATLATAYVIFNYLDTSIVGINFNTKSGSLKPKKKF